MAHGDQHRGIDVDGSLDRLADPLSIRRPCFKFRTRTAQPYGLTTTGYDASAGPETLVVVRPGLLREAVFARCEPGVARRLFGHRHEQELVQVGRPLAGQPVGRFRPGRIAVEVDQLDVTIGPVFGQPERPGSHELLERPVAARVDDLLGIDRRATVLSRREPSEG